MLDARAQDPLQVRVDLGEHSAQAVVATGQPMSPATASGRAPMEAGRSTTTRTVPCLACSLPKTGGERRRVVREPGGGVDLTPVSVSASGPNSNTS